MADDTTSKPSSGPSMGRILGRAMFGAFMPGTTAEDTILGQLFKPKDDPTKKGSIQGEFPDKMRKGGAIKKKPVKKMAKGGSVSSRADGCARKGKTKGRFC